MKKINKRACRRFFNPGFRFDRNSGILYAEAYEYIVRTAIKNIGGRRTLLFYLYSREELKMEDAAPVFTIFFTKEDDATLTRGEGGKLRWRQGDLERLLYNGYKSCHYAFYFQRDQETIDRYFRCEEGQGMSVFASFQYTIREKRAEKRQLQKERIIDLELSCFPKLAPTERNWLKKKLLPEYIFYDYRKRKAPANCFCTACNHPVELPATKHNEKGVCPRCKREVTYKSRGKQHRVWDRASGQFLRKLDDRRLGISVWKVERFYFDGERRDYLRESARYILEHDGNGVITDIQDYYNSYQKRLVTSWCRGMRPQLSYLQFNYEGDPTAVLYQAGLEDCLRGTPWQYSQIGSFAEAYGAMQVLPYLNAYRRFPQMEYLVKLKLYRLAASCVRWPGNYYAPYGESVLNLSGKTAEQVLGVPRELIPLLQRQNPNISQLEMVRTLAAQGVRKDLDELLVWCKAHDIEDKELVAVPLRYMTFHRWSRYLTNQFPLWRERHPSSWTRRDPLCDLATEYRDYLRMCQRLDRDLKNDFVLFPRDLKTQHDRMTERSQRLEREANDTAILRQYEKNLKLYGFSDEQFRIVAPKSCRDIHREGDVLHHCVGTYAESMADGRTTILFLRRRVEITKPYCTVEVKNGEVMQSRCYKNQDPPREVQEFIRRWMIVVHRRMMRQIEEREEILIAA